jgi:hypothetical protein
MEVFGSSMVHNIPTILYDSPIRTDLIIEISVVSKTVVGRPRKIVFFSRIFSDFWSINFLHSAFKDMYLHLIIKSFI